MTSEFLNPTAFPARARSPPGLRWRSAGSGPACAGTASSSSCALMARAVVASPPCHAIGPSIPIVLQWPITLWMDHGAKTPGGASRTRLRPEGRLCSAAQDRRVLSAARQAEGSWREARPYQEASAAPRSARFRSSTVVWQGQDSNLCRRSRRFYRSHHRHPASPVRSLPGLGHRL